MTGDARKELLEGCAKIEAERRKPHVEAGWIALGPGGFISCTCAYSPDMAEALLFDFLKSHAARKNCRIVTVRIEEVMG